MRVLLIDGDIVAYQIATKYERGPDWDGDGNTSQHIDPDRVKDQIEGWIVALKQKLEASGAIVAMSDASRRYFRHDIWPTYKANRQQGTPPKSLGTVKGLMRQPGINYESVTIDRFEADDVLGYLATDEDAMEKIIVTEDKDLTQIPGKHYWLHKKDLGIDEVSREQADYFHLWQTLVGDPIDGYPGLRGVGPVKAQKILNVPARDRWAAVVDAYKRRDHTEEDALVQARVARVLRVEDINLRTMEPMLWVP